MAKVNVVRTVRIGGRSMAVKRVPNFATVLHKAHLDATVTQLRVIAEETREMIIDKLMAAEPQAPGTIIVPRPRRKRRAGGELADRTPYDHEPLKDWYAKKKARLELDGRKLIASGDYIRGIEVFKGKQASGVYYMVRPEDRLHVPVPGLSGTKPIMLKRLARVLEFGSAKHKVPPRPHWRPVLRAIMGRFRFLRRTIRAEALRLALKRLR